MSKVYVEVPGKVWAAVLMGAFLGLLSPNPLLTTTSLLVLPFLIFPLWRQGEPPALPFLIFFQWLEVTLKIFHADLAGITVEQFFKVGEKFYEGNEIVKALWLSLAGLASLSIGMRLGIMRLKTPLAEISQTKPVSFSRNRLFTGYLIFSILSVCSNFFVWQVLPLSQILLALLNIKWIFLYLLVYTVLKQKTGYSYLPVVLLLEIGGGFLSFHAQFKGIFIVFVVVFLTLHFRMRMKHVVAAVVVFSIAVFLGIIWTSVKKEWRSFLKPVEVHEGIEVPVEAPVSVKERTEKLFELLHSVNLRRGTELLAERIAYVDLFAHVLQMVPQYVPYEEGRLWKRALMNTGTPRLFFPHKEDLESDSEVTRRYSGIMVAGPERGTSIGIGYFAESYVDFGPKFMFVPIFLLGLFQGLVYRYFISRPKIGLMGYAVTTSVLLFSGVSIATSPAKIVGGLVINLIIMASFLKFFGRRFLRWAGQRQLMIRPTA